MQREGFAAISARHVATDQGRKGPHAPKRAASALDLEEPEMRLRASTQSNEHDNEHDHNPPFNTPDLETG